METARRELAGALEISSIEAGLQTVGWLSAGIREDAAATAAAARHVEVVPLGSYSRKPPVRQGLQLGFAAVDAGEIRRGVRELAAALGTARKAGVTPRP